MAISDTIQTLSAAFSFGTVLQAAITALLLYLKGHDTKLSQDRRRLVLVVFLLFAALWAQVDFLSLLVPTSKTSGCQITTSVSSAFDQIARVAIGAYLLFSIGHGIKSAAEKYVLGVLVGVRVVAGAVFVAFTRPQFAPLCVAQSSLSPVAIVVIALDVIIIGVLAIRIIQLGLMNGSSSDRQAQNKALTFVTIGFTIWTGTSVPMELGMPSIILLVRTAIPASGLGLLIGMLTIFPGALISPQYEDDLASEAQSPFRPDPPRSLGAFNNTGDRSGSPVVTVGYGKNGRLFVTNPSDTPRDSPTRAFQSSKGEDKGKDVKVRITELKNGAGESSRTGVSALAGSAITLGSGAPITAVPAPSSQQKKSLFGRSKENAPSGIRALGISQPVMDPVAANDPQAPFARMQMVDLKTAAVNERSRREDAATRTPYTPNTAPLSAEEGLRKSTSTKRKEIPNTRHEPMPSSSSAESLISSDISTNGANASSTSASFSPNRDEVRRRSPRHATLEEKQTYTMPPPLKQKLVVGLPNGPRSTLMPSRQRFASPKAETVMLLNDIVYDNPAEVNSLINTAALLGVSPGVPTMKEKDLERDFRDSETIPADILPSYNSTIRSIDSTNSTESMLNRPRPYSRARTKSRGLFPSDISEEVQPLTRRRSKSTGSLMMRKSMLADHPGSPTSLGALPPLPPPPTTASKLAKILPKSTSGMTSDEKISMLFPAPPGVPNKTKRRSSVPSIPSMILDDIRQTSQFFRPMPFNDVVETRNAVEEPESPILRRETYRFSANTYQNIARFRDSGPELVIPSTQITTVSAVRDNVANDPAPAPASRPKPAAIPRKPLDSEYEDEVPVSPEELNGEISYEDYKEFSLSDDEGSEDEQHEIETPNGEDDTPAGFKSFPWHRRIGDELPTFSDRRDQSRPRAMPPPPPLLLNQTTRNAAVVVRDTEPEPADSPSRAIAEIQAQLNRFEERDRASVISLLSKFPADGSISKPVTDDGRSELLKNLEKEMGMQENAWMQLHHNFDRDSTGSILTPVSLPQDQARPIISRQPSAESSASLRSLSTTPGSVERATRPKKELAPAPQNQSPMLRRETSRASMWQQRLAQAQEEYLGKAAELQTRQSVNFLSIKSATKPTSTPTLPEIKLRPEPKDIGKPSASESGRPKASLWKQASPVPKQPNSSMWTHPAPSTSDRSATPESPAVSLRPAQRRDMVPLAHNSSTLWMKPATSGLSATRPPAGLWGSKMSRPKSIQTRPVTQRPPRRSKRITFLPDIVESPSPLPHNRDTLGLYQFPWGEKSDNAVYQPAVNPALMMHMGQPALNPALQARSQELEAEEYSSSFFDDYDEEEFDDDEDDYENNQDVESDDDFDESTLWEIASLLKTKEGVPSKDSLLPAARGTIDHYEFEDFEDGPGYVEDQSLFLPASYPTQQRSSLWMENNESPAAMKVIGLPQPPADVWESYIPFVEEKPRSRPASQAPLPSLASKQLWGSEASEQEVPAESSKQDIPVVVQNELPAPVEETIQYAPLPSTVFVQPAIWKRSKTPEPELQNTGLFAFDNTRSQYRTTIASPVAKDLRIQRVSTLEVPPSLESSDMWNAPKAKDHHVSWIDRSVVAPASVPAVAVSVQSTNGMWTLPIKFQVDSAVGLYSPGQLSARISDKEPAAVGMVSKPRSARDNISPPTSRRLWRRDDLIMIECDWISESSIRPTSPSIDSISSGATSPASDRSSINSVGSASTKASSIWSTMSAMSAAAISAKPGWAVPKRKPAPSLPSMPEKGDEEEKNSQFVSKLPVRQNSQKLPTPAARRDSKVLANAAMFENRVQVEKAGVRRTLSAARASKAVSKFAPPPPKPVYVPLRQQFRPIFIANWDEALQEAIAAGSPKQTKSVVTIERKKVPTRIPRRTTSPTEWVSALELAIAAGIPKTVRPSSTKPIASPADWAAALEVAIAAGTPRIIHHSLVRPTASPSDWDLALESAISEGYLRSARIQPVSNLWIAPVAAPKASKIPMWQSPTSSISPRASIFDAVRGETLRKAKPSRSASLEKLTSHSFWRSDDNVKTVAKHWLNASRVRSVAALPALAQMSSAVIRSTPSEVMWTAPAKSITPNSTTSIWSKPARTEVVREDIFNNVVGETIRKSKPASSAPLPTLASKSFWQPYKNVKSTSFNWLIDTKTKPASTSSTASMWTKPVRSGVVSEDIFSNVMAETIRKSKPSSSAPLPILTSKSFWQPSKTLEATSFNWLLDMKTKPSSANSAVSMWTYPVPLKLVSEDMFSNVMGETIRKSKPSNSSPLPKLTSDSFWQPRKNLQSISFNWLLETKAKPSPANSAASMWTNPAPLSKVVSEDMFSNVMSETIRKSKSSNSAPLPKLKSDSFWQPRKNVQTMSFNWLIDAKNLKPESRQIPTPNMSHPKLAASTTPAMNEKALTWSAPQKAGNIFSPNTKSMWTPSQLPTARRLDIFTSIPTTTIRKASTKKATLPKLKSTQLFTPSPKEEDSSNLHWLYVSSKTLRTPVTPEVPSSVGGFDFGFAAQLDTIEESTSGAAYEDESDYDDEVFDGLDDGPIEVDFEDTISSISEQKPVMWVPTGQSKPMDAEVKNNLWVPTTNSPNLFEEVYKSEKRFMKNKREEKVEGIKSFELWRPSGTIPQSPRNWLIQKRGSRVDFRY